MSTEGDAGESGAGAGALNLKQVASRLGVHYMTAYRYVRQGRLPGELVGGHWRVHPRAVADLLSAGGTCPPATDPGERRVDWVGRLVDQLVSGDEPSAWRVVESALASGHTAEAAYLDLISPALQSIGYRWEIGDLGVADQHVATAVASRLVARLGARFRRPGRSRGAVVFGAPAGELHSLPIAIAADVVRLAGFEVLELGANAPPEAFSAASERTRRLVAVGIGITTVAHLGAVRAVVGALSILPVPPPILVGGSGAAEAERAGLEGIYGYACDGRQAVALVEALAERRAQS